MVDFFIGRKSELPEDAGKDVILLTTSDKFKNLASVDGKGSDNKCIGIIFTGKYKVGDILKAKRLTDHVVVKYNSQIRSVMERVKDIYVYGVENVEGRDFIHHRNSGLNHVLAKIAHENKIKFVFNFKAFLDLSNLKQGVTLGRLKQNLLLCRKFKAEYIFASFCSNKYEYRIDFSPLRRLLESNRLD